MPFFFFDSYFAYNIYFREKTNIDEFIVIVDMPWQPLIQKKVEWKEDILNGGIKSLVFAIVVTWIALHKGYDAVPTSEGISKATTATVVQSSLVILGLDFVMTALMFGS